MTTTTASAFSFIQGIKCFKQHKEKKSNRYLPLPIIVFLLVVLPFTYAYIYQQESHGITQMILNLKLMDEDFEDVTPPEAPSGWTPVDGKWSTCYDGNNTVYVQDDNSEKKALAVAASGNASWSDYIYQVRVKFVVGNPKKPDAGALLIFRYQDANHYYYLRVEEYENMIKLYQKGAEGIGLERGSTIIDVVNGTWYSFKITIAGQIVNVWVDDIQYFTDVYMEQTLTTGQVGVGTRYYQCYFDDITVTEI